MGNDSDRLLDTLADQAADLDDIVEDNESTHLDIFVDLQMFPDNRNPAIWESAYNALLVDFDAMTLDQWFEMTTEDYVALEETPMRQVYWQAMVAAAKAQADVQAMRQALSVADGHANSNKSLFDKLNDQDKKIAAKEGIGNDRFKTAKDRKKDGGSDSN